MPPRPAKPTARIIHPPTIAPATPMIISVRKPRPALPIIFPVAQPAINPTMIHQINPNIATPSQRAGAFPGVQLLVLPAALALIFRLLAAKRIEMVELTLAVSLDLQGLLERKRSHHRGCESCPYRHRSSILRCQLRQKLLWNLNKREPVPSTPCSPRLLFRHWALRQPPRLPGPNARFSVPAHLESSSAERCPDVRHQPADPRSLRSS